MQLRDAATTPDDVARLWALEAKARMPARAAGEGVTASAALHGASPWLLAYAQKTGLRLERLTASEQAEWLALMAPEAQLDLAQGRRLVELARRARGQRSFPGRGAPWPPGGRPTTERRERMSTTEQHETSEEQRGVRSCGGRAARSGWGG